MTYLPDVNVWLALASRRHSHAQAANQWLVGVDRETIAFCRITQMGLLRLLTNNKVMGVDVISRAEAWEVYSKIQQDRRMTFLGEPTGLEDGWRSLTQSPSVVPGDWTDAYLLAFAKARELTLVTFDQVFQTIPDANIVVLS